jgi:hypothetical protein
MSVARLCLLALSVCALATTGCSLILGEPLGGAPAQPPEGMPPAIGPTVEIGRGESLGIGWRYLVYESEMGTCTVVEQGPDMRGGGCGGALGPAPGSSAIGLSSVGSSTGSPTTIEGFATDEVNEVWIEVADGEPVRAELMSLAPAEREGAIFLAFVPEGLRLVQVVGLGDAGQVVDEEPLTNP